MAPTLIPDLDELYNCPFYWGKIEEEEAEAILKDKPVGSYLVKDAEEDENHQLELFYVRRDLPIGKRLLHFGLNCVISNGMKGRASLGDNIKFGRTGRHTFISFEKEHTERCLVSLQYPVLRKRPFSLQELARSNIRKTAVSFDGISQLELPEKLKKFLKEHKYLECSPLH